jgi:septal ring factor EnvC (AmiA/AmiB activator)
VDPAKMDAFKKFMDEKKSLITANKDLRKENFQLRKEIQEIKKRIFSEKQRQALADKLAKKEKSVLERLLNVIDTYSSKTKNERLKSQLAELKEITQERIDALK